MRIKIKQKIIYASILLLCITALVGHLLPLMSINIDVFDRVSQSTDISIGNIMSIRNDADSPLGGIDAPDSVFSGLLGGDEGMDGVAGKMMTTMGLYLVSLVLLIFVLVLSILNKFRKTSIAVLAVSLSAYVYIGFTVSNLAADIIGTLEQRLGFFAMLFNLSEMITIVLGNGYWLTISAITCMMLVKIIQCCIKNRDGILSNEKG